jgi:hypothetical protein
MRLRTLIGACAIVMLSGFSVIANDESQRFNTRLTGFRETPAILTTGTGTFTSTLDAAGTSLSYTLTFSGLSSDTTVSHIHFGQPGVAGAIVVFLCGGGDKPTCPPAGGTVSGTIVAADVLAVPAQGINEGSFEDFLIVMRSGLAYVNVHSADHAAGEIRGQIRRGQLE